MSPLEAVEAIDGGIFSLAPEEGHIRGPIMRSQFQGHPTMFVDSPESDFVNVIFVLPYEPTDLGELIVLRGTHDGAKIDTAGLNIEIHSSIAITAQENGATIRINGKAGISAVKQ